MGVIIFGAIPQTPPKKVKLEFNVLIFGQILNILTFNWAIREANGRFSWPMARIRALCVSHFCMRVGHTSDTSPTLIAEWGTASVARLAALLGEQMDRTQCSMWVAAPRTRGPLSAG